MVRSILIVAAIAIFIGCQSGVRIVFNKDYEEANFSERNVTHLPISLNAIHVNNSDDIKKDFKLDKRTAEIIVQDSLYKKMIYQSTLSLLSGKLTLTNLPFDLFQTQTDTSKYSAVKFRLRIAKVDSEYTFFVPKKSIFQTDSLDIGIVINDITITRQSYSYGPDYTPGQTISTPGGSFQTVGHWSGGGSGIIQEATIKFIMWDYKSNRPITYGITTASGTGTLSGSYLSTVFRVAAQRVFEKSPFRWKRIVQEY